MGFITVSESIHHTVFIMTPEEGNITFKPKCCDLSSGLHCAKVQKRNIVKLLKLIFQDFLQRSKLTFSSC